MIVSIAMIWLATWALAQDPAAHVPVPPATSLEVISPQSFRDRVAAMDAMVAACEHSLTPEDCKVASVGPDVVVSLPSGNRVVRFTWLRSLMDEVEHAPAKPAPVVPDLKAAPANSGGKGGRHFEPPTPTTSTAPEELLTADVLPPLGERLQQARARLKQEMESAVHGGSDGSSQAKLADRQQLDSILGAKEFHTAAVGRTLRERALEKLASWINIAVSKLVGIGSKSKWIGIAAEIVFTSSLCVVLVWFLIRLERQARFAPLPLHGGLTGAPSERDWQLWLTDAQQAASSKAWREAIHYLYWASVSRLESSGLWPADRTRTPREYLALLAEEPARRGNTRSQLAELTRSFERTWYAGQHAEESDFNKAESLAASLGVGVAGVGQRGREE